MVTGPRLYGRLQQCQEAVRIFRASHWKDAATQTLFFAEQVPTKLTARPLVSLDPIPRPDIFVPAPRPPPLDRPKVFRPPFAGGYLGALAYEFGVLEAYAFLAPGHHPIFGRPIGRRMNRS